jgi:hypothetical protein
MLLFGAEMKEHFIKETVSRDKYFLGLRVVAFSEKVKFLQSIRIRNRGRKRKHYLKRSLTA